MNSKEDVLLLDKRCGTCDFGYPLHRNPNEIECTAEPPDCYNQDCKAMMSPNEGKKCLFWELKQELKTSNSVIREK